MKQYVPIDKRSKKSRKEYYSAMRQDWGGVKPATLTLNDKRVYNRAREKSILRDTP